MSSTTRPIVFMDIKIGETPGGRIKMELFSDIVPKCVRVFDIDLLVLRETEIRTCDQDSRELQTALYWRMQVIRIFLFLASSVFSDQVKDVTDGTLVHKATRMLRFTGELFPRRSR
ncbi:hypothetical protein JVU11DRAFT_1286 [Chiua virens]|nr:hypothetical protein JVU11DRAFT_1286 [Chiua virens]